MCQAMLSTGDGRMDRQDLKSVPPPSRELITTLPFFPSQFRNWRLLGLRDLPMISEPPASGLVNARPGAGMPHGALPFPTALNAEICPFAKLFPSLSFGFILPSSLVSNMIKRLDLTW